MGCSVGGGQVRLVNGQKTCFQKVRESFMSGCCLVDGLPLNEFRVLGEKCSASPDMRDEKNRRMEFSTNPVTILNSLENMGYKVAMEPFHT